MLGSAAFRTGVAPGGALAGPWVKNELYRKARAVPSLDLRFADDKLLTDAITGANLVTFTRASSGTFVGSGGLIQSAVTNLLLRSEELDNASWTKQSSVSVSANTTVAPNGTLTADTITWTSASVNTGIYAQILSGLAASVAHTKSIYVRADSAGGTVQLTDPTFTAGITTINLTTEWQRIQLTENTPIAGSAGVWVRKTASSPNTIYLWGAQLEQASTVGEYIPTTSAINSAPRFDHNPTTGESLGLLVEEARTNLLLNSATLSTQSVTVAAAANTLSFYGTGTVTLTGVSTSGPLVGTGANNRVSLTFTPIVGVLILTVSGSVTNAQLEAGAFPTSYIPTTSATVTRAADVASITGTAFSSFYNQTEGTLFADAAEYPFASSLVRNFYSLGSSTNPNTDYARQWIWNGNTTLLLNSAYTSSSGPVAAEFNVSLATGSKRTAFAIRANDYARSFNGQAAATDTAGNMPVGIDRLGIGSDNSSGFLSGTIRRLTFWPTRLPNNTLQAITQP